MKNLRVFLYILYFWIGLSFFYCNPELERPTVDKGILDLKSYKGKPWDLHKDGSVKINGDWEFYWNELLDLEEILDHTEKTYMPVPSQWQKHNYPAYGYATYHSTIYLSKETDFSQLAIEMTDAASNYKLFINKKLISLNGTVGTNESESIPFMRHSILTLDGLEKSNQLDIVLQVSNFHYHKGGFWNYIKIGSKENIFRDARESLIIKIIVCSAISVMGVYHIILYFHRKNILSTLAFGIFCFIAVTRDLSINERFILDIFPFLPFYLVHKIEFFTFYLGTYVFCHFVYSLFPDEFDKRLLILLATILFPCAFLVIFFQMNVYGEILYFIQILVFIEIVYILGVLIYASIKKRVGARLFLLGWILFSIAIMNDILKTQNNLPTPDLASYGLLVFVLFQATIISRKFSFAFIEMERLSIELKLLTEGLEKKVHERTLKLEEAVIELEKLAESRKRLSIIGEMASGIVHDIKNPMTTIKSFAELACSPDTDENERLEYINFITREIDRLSDMTFEILDFSKGTIQLNPTQIYLPEFKAEIYEYLRFDFEHLQIQLSVNCDWDGSIFADKERLRRVIVNLANNAREAMSGGQKEYKFQIKFIESGEFIQILIIDNGPGIPASLEDKIFKPFSTEGKAKGTGLGLFMSKWIIEKHGGTISYHSIIQQGTTFTILIPKKLFT